MFTRVADNAEGIHVALIRQQLRQPGCPSMGQQHLGKRETFKSILGVHLLWETQRAQIGRFEKFLG
jgi:hypothetical protein